MFGHLSALIANGWTAYSFAATLAGGLGIGLIALALLATAYLPAFIRRPLITVGIGLIVGSALYQAGQTKGAHDAFERDAARAVLAEKLRTAAAEKVTADLAAQATHDIAAAQADAAKLKDLNDALSRDADSRRDCTPRGDARRLRNL